MLVPEQLHPQTLAAWQQLQQILERAEGEGRITYCYDEQGRPINDHSSRHLIAEDGLTINR